MAQVYDPKADEQPVHQSQEDEDGHTRAAGKAGDPRGDFTPGGDASDPRGDLARREAAPGVHKSPNEDGESSDTPSLGGLQERENSSGNSFQFRQDDDKIPGYKKFVSGLKKNKKKGGLIAGGTGGLATALVVALLAIIPLKVETMVNDLEHNFFSSAEDASQKETDQLVGHYIIKDVLPDYKGCGTTLDRKCKVSAVSDGKNPVRNLYRSWANERLENDLADRGLEFRRTADGKWHMKTSGLDVDIGRNGENFDKEFNKASRADMRAAFRSKVAGETRWKQTMYRFKVGKLLEQKYGIKRCIVFCGKRDAFADRKDARKNAAKLLTIQRVITPRNQSLGIVLECLLTSCNATDADTTSDSSSLNGAGENSETDTKVRKGLEELAAKYGAQNIDELVKIQGAISEKGLSNYAVKAALEPAIGEVAAGKTADAIPILGWINLAAQVVDAGQHAGPAIKKMNYVTNAAAAVAMYSMYRSYADEIHTGHADANEVGSFNESLGSGDYKNKDDKIVGGSASAENTPLYQHVINHKSLADASADNNAPVSKDSDGNPEKPGANVCKDGKPIPSGKVVCDELQLGGGNGIANSISELLKQPEFFPLVTLADAWNSVVKPIVGLIGGVFSTIVGGVVSAGLIPYNAACGDGIIKHAAQAVLPGGFVYCKAKDVAQDAIPAVGKAVTNYLIPSPLGSNNSGGRNFEVMAAGADVSGNEYAQHGLGGQKLTPAQVATIKNSSDSVAREDFNSQSMFARMFSTTNQYSLVSRMALSVPTTATTGANTAVATFTSPFSTVFHSIGSMLSGRTFAANTPEEDPFKVTQYGYPDGTIPEDSEYYWDQHCDDKPQQGYQNDAEFLANGWNESANKNISDDTEMPVNTTTNPCMLIKASAGSDGAVADTRNLTDDERAILNENGGAGNAPATATVTGTLPTGTSKELATQLLQYNGKQITCLTGISGPKTGCPDIANTASGSSIKGGSCAVDALHPGILGLMLGLVKAGHSFVLSALCSDHGTSDGLREHNGGRAADFNFIDGVFIGPEDAPWDSTRNDAVMKLDKDAAALVPQKQIEFGQVGAGGGHPQCHPGSPNYDFQVSGPPNYPDFCHHQHIAVETP